MQTLFFLKRGLEELDAGDVLVGGDFWAVHWVVDVDDRSHTGERVGWHTVVNIELMIFEEQVFELRGSMSEILRYCVWSVMMVVGGQETTR